MTHTSSLRFAKPESRSPAHPRSPPNQPTQSRAQGSSLAERDEKDSLPNRVRTPSNSKRCVGVPWRTWRVRGRKRGSVRLGVERWFERKHSYLRGRVKNYLDRSPFSVGSGPIRPRVRPRGRHAASSAGSCAAVPGAGESIEYRRRHFFGLLHPNQEYAAPSPVASQTFWREFTYQTNRGFSRSP